MLTNEQIRELVDIIRNHHAAFVYSNITKDIDPNIIVDLQKKGLLRAGDDVRSHFKDAYEIERLKSVLETARGKNLSYDQMKKYLFANPVPLTDTEISSINHIEQSAGKYITKQGDLLSHGLDEVVRNANINLKQDILGQTIKTPLQEGIKRRKMVTQIVSDMRNASDDQFRDWHRIAQTELQNARNHAKIDQIHSVSKDKTDDQIHVYKRPNPDACKVCKSVYLESDGVTPKVFTMSEFKKNVSNFGLKTKKWQPTVETVHPWCKCEMATLPPGFGFDKDGQIIFKSTKYKHKPVKPEPAEANWNLYDSKGNLRKSKIIDQLRKSKHRCDLVKALSKTKRTKFTVTEMIQTLNLIKSKKDELKKGRKPFPIGTVHNGRKKMPNGDWVPVNGTGQTMQQKQKQAIHDLIADLNSGKKQLPKEKVDLPKIEINALSNKTVYSIDELSKDVIEGQDGRKYRISSTGKKSAIEYKSPKGTDTNLVGYVALGKTKKENQQHLNEQIQGCELILDEMGVKFKTPIDFVCQSLNRTTNANASFEPLQNKQDKLGMRNRINIERNQNIQKSLIHEIGHAMDFAFGEVNYLSEELQLTKDQRTKLKEAFKKLEEIAKNSPEYKRADPSRYRYLTEKTEMFARGFEVYGYSIAQDLIDKGKIDPSFLTMYTPDYISGSSKLEGGIKEAKPNEYKEYEELKKEQDDAWKKTKEFHDKSLVVFKEMNIEDENDPGIEKLKAIKKDLELQQKKYKSLKTKVKKKWREMHQNVKKYADRNDKDKIIKEVSDIMKELISGSEFKRAQEGYENNLKKSNKSSKK